MDILVTKDITKHYAQNVALQEVNISIPQKTIFGLLGPNGAGKTTLIRIINQIIAADSGEILINGEKLKPQHIEIIGYLPEERGLYKKMGVGEQLLYLAQLKGLSRHEAQQRIRHWFDKFDISSWWKKNIEDLSKGMAQKVQFIATVVHEPKLIILDEPFSGFDPVNANLIKDEILELREKGSTIIFSTHRMESVEELCDHIALIHKSKKVLDGPKKAIKEAYRANTFIVVHRGEILQLNHGFELLDHNLLEDDYYQSVIKIPESRNPNDLLQELIGKVEIHGLQEKIPSINEIFISKVKEADHA